MITKSDLQEAYREGFCDGEDFANQPYRFPPVAVAWYVSTTREFILPPPSGEAAELVSKWEMMSTDERVRLADPSADNEFFLGEPLDPDYYHLPDITLDSTFVVGLSDQTPEIWYSDLD